MMNNNFFIATMRIFFSFSKNNITNIYYITEKREKRKRNVIKEMKEKRMELN